MPGKKHSKVNTLRAFLTPQTGIFDQKYRRCVNCQQTLGSAVTISKAIVTENLTTRLPRHNCVANQRHHRSPAIRCRGAVMNGWMVFAVGQNASSAFSHTVRGMPTTAKLRS